MMPEQYCVQNYRVETLLEVIVEVKALSEPNAFRPALLLVVEQHQDSREDGHGDNAGEFFVLFAPDTFYILLVVLLTNLSTYTATTKSKACPKGSR